jgi:hypothetical protein
MKTFVITLLGLVAMLAGYDLPAEAAQAKRQQIVRYSHTFPPAEYDKPYAGELEIVRIANEADMLKICKGISKYACSSRTIDPSKPPHCIIFLLPDKRTRGYGSAAVAHVWHHELAHCNGWTQKHENGHKASLDSPIAMPALPASMKELPVYPPLVCVTPEWKQEPCKNRTQTVTANASATLPKRSRYHGLIVS